MTKSTPPFDEPDDIPTTAVSKKPPGPTVSLRPVTEEDELDNQDDGSPEESPGGPTTDG